MEGIELAAFQIISTVGTARSCYIEAIQQAKKGLWVEAAHLISEGDKAFTQGHDAHMSLLTQETEEKKWELNLLLVHAEDQLMSAEGFKILALEFIDVYKKLLVKEP